MMAMMYAAPAAQYEHLLDSLIGIFDCGPGDQATTNTLAMEAGLLTGKWWRYTWVHCSGEASCKDV